MQAPFEKGFRSGKMGMYTIGEVNSHSFGHSFLLQAFISAAFCCHSCQQPVNDIKAVITLQLSAAMVTEGTAHLKSSKAARQAPVLITGHRQEP